ncbi:MAG: hypothetical protein EXX96DRAFT_569204 [Benjaminiella poitrasii]|nr:MAG: hypothetical protein EXX96DRAFT_569204 [Benjaminiella poitrasii]
MSSLPFEVLVSIFELLFTDTSKPADLLQCQLVCKIWSYPAQHLLYTDIHIRNEISLLDYVHTIRNSCSRNLGALAKKLTLYNYEILFNSFQFRDCYNAIAKLCVNVREIALVYSLEGDILLQCNTPTAFFYEKFILEKTRQGYFKRLGKIPACRSYKGFVAYNQMIVELRNQMQEINTIGYRLKRPAGNLYGRNASDSVQAVYRSDVCFPLVKTLRLSEWKMMSPFDFDRFIERYPKLELLELKSDIDHLMWMSPTEDEIRHQQQLDDTPIDKAVCKPRPDFKVFACNAFQTTSAFFDYFMYKFPCLQSFYRKDFCLDHQKEISSRSIDIKAKWINFVTKIPKHYYEFHHAWDAKDVLYQFFKLAAVTDKNNKLLYMNTFEVSYDIFEMRKSPCLTMLNSYRLHGLNYLEGLQQTRKISLLYPPSRTIEDLFRYGGPLRDRSSMTASDSQTSSGTDMDDYFPNEAIPHKELLECVGLMLSSLTLKYLSEWEHHVEYKGLVQHALIQCPNLSTLIIERGAEVCLDDFFLPPLNLQNLTIRSCMISSNFFQTLSASLPQLDLLTIDCCFINSEDKKVITIDLTSTAIGTIEYTKYWKREGIFTNTAQMKNSGKIKYYLKLETIVDSKRKLDYYFSDFTSPQMTRISEDEYDKPSRVNDPKTTTWFHIKCIHLNTFYVDVGELKTSPKIQTTFFF